MYGTLFLFYFIIHMYEDDKYLMFANIYIDQKYYKTEIFFEIITI